MVPGRFPFSSVYSRSMSSTFSWLVLNPKITQSTEICGLMDLARGIHGANVGKIWFKNKVNVKNTLTIFQQIATW